MRKLLAVWLCFGLMNFPVFAQVPATKSRLVIADVDMPEDIFAGHVAVRNQFIKAFEKYPQVSIGPRKDIEAWRVRKEKEKRQDSSKDKVAEARELLARGKHAYATLNFKAALSLLEEARRQFIMNLQALRSNRDLLDAHLYLGVVYTALKSEAKAREEFKKVVNLDPKRELSTREFAPKVTELFAKVRQSVLAEEPIKVSFESSPSGAQVFINARLSGATPAQFTLQPGEYFILIEKDGLAPWYQPITLSRRTQTFRVRLNPKENEAQWAAFFRVREGDDQKSPDMGIVRQLGEAMSANLIFLGGVTKEQDYRLFGQLYDVRTADFSKVAFVVLEKGPGEIPEVTDDLVEELMKSVRPDGYLIPDRADLSPNLSDLTVGGADRPNVANIAVAAPAEKKWYQHWWIWPFVAAAGVGIYFGAREFSQSNQSGKIIVNNKGNF